MPTVETDEGRVENDIIPTELAIRAMRDSGYRNTAYALAELIDNSAQAGATHVEVFCLEEANLITQRSRRRVKYIAVLDNGSGMSAEVLRVALQFGNGTHLNDRSGIGRFGMGLPNASISQGKRVDVWTWRTGPDNALHSYLDIDEIEAGKMRVVPPPKEDPVPLDWRKRGVSFGTTGTLVVWSKLDEERLSWKGGRATLHNTETIVGRMYRKFIHRGDLRIQLRALDGDSVLFDQDAKVNDPLYIMVPSSTSAPFGTEPMFQMWGESDANFPVTFQGKTYQVTVRATWARDKTLPDDGTDRGNKSYGKDAAKNIGVSIVRADRELDLDGAWTINDPRERWWGVEVDFPPELDEVFGVTNNKQAATVFSHLANFDWRQEANAGEEYLDYKRRITEEGDPRAQLIDIVNHISTILPKIRLALGSQTKGRRSNPGKRHDDTSAEDRATTKFKERAKVGKGAPSDEEIFDEEAKVSLVEDLIKNKNYTEPVATEIADATLKRKRKVIFIEAESEMEAFFGVELGKAGGLTEIVFNRSHPTFKHLIDTLNADTTGATERDLVARIENAAETLEMILAAWARLEIEDVPNRERLRRMRQDWGRMARDFLTDDDEDT